MKITTRSFFATLLLLIILAGFGYYAFRYIQATSFMIEDTRYYNLFDDAMISMRYAWNLANGNGLVWNAGEYVEGFTNPLWVFYMAFWHLLPLTGSGVSLAIQISGAVFLAINLVFLYLIVRHLSNDLLALTTALVMTAFYGPLAIWGLLGMEVSLLTLILSLSVWIALTRDLARWHLWLYLLLGFSTLVRVDMAVPAVLIIGFLAFTDRQNRIKHLLWGTGFLAAFLGGQTLLRYWYYGELLPNTYTLKMVGLSPVIRIARGIWVLFELAWQMNWVIFLSPLAIFLFRRDKNVLLLALLFAGQVAYSTYVGGDAWEHRGGANRFISTALPLWFALFGLLIASLRKTIQTALQLNGWKNIPTQVIALLLVAFSLWNANFLLADYRNIERWTLQRKPAYIESHEKYVRTALILEKITHPNAKIAVVAAGTAPYHLPDRYIIDLLGKADKTIARQNIKSSVSLAGIADVRPGHMKWDYAYSIGELQPDVIVQLWEEDYASAEPYLGNYRAVTIEGLPFYLRIDSPMIIWDNVR
jgi:arabinofuranosyltransferase